MKTAIARALISVSDKEGLLPLANALRDFGVEILSSGGTAKALKEAGIATLEVSDHTGFPEMLDGRVKTLHPRLHGGILGRRDLATHREAMQSYDIPPIDLVVVNLYPFEATVKSGANPETVIENIDIGGPALIRSASKNFAHVAVLTSPKDYAAFLEHLGTHQGATLLEFRKSLAFKAFAHTAAYDTAIQQWFAKQEDVNFPEKFLLSGALRQKLRYGENPHQQAAFYASSEAGLAGAKQLQGKELSYNNLLDSDAALKLIAEFSEPAAVIIKHNNPCGVATGSTILEAYRRAFACDKASAFGGIVAVNRPLDAEAAAEITEIFTEVILAPAANTKAEDIIAKKKNLRLLLLDMKLPEHAMEIRQVTGGFLLQDMECVEDYKLKHVTKTHPDAVQLKDLLFAFKVCKHVKSNAIILVKDGKTIGIGAGQMSRKDSIRIACEKAREAGYSTEGAVLASDAFFPFSDNVDLAKAAGIAAVIQPGGSVKDDEVIAAADEAGIAMSFTGVRHFRH